MQEINNMKNISKTALEILYLQIHLTYIPRENQLVQKL